jgi:hypothetical protein
VNSVIRMIRSYTAVFALFFGVSTLEEFQTQNWLKALFWLAIGVVFLTTDNSYKHQLHD